MAHCLAVCANGGRRNKVRVTQACYGWFWHRLQFRWKSDQEGNFRLEMKTKSHYGTDLEDNPITIQFHVTSLWAN
jgi:hypothetical protein